MYIEPGWRILTIGDGDLSFSVSLLRHYQPANLIATVFDSEPTLKQKYKTDNIDVLREAGVQVLTEFDVTQPKSWQSLPTQQFDLVIFQFPLCPALGNREALEQGLSINTLNRALLRKFLQHAESHFLDKNGAGLAYISSKDVKPYIEWDIERALAEGLALRYQGKQTFEIGRFPGYKIRNVDRDKHVKDTEAFTHVWSLDDWSFAAAPLIPAAEPTGNACAICRAGPFTTEQERTGHLASKKHRRLTEFHQQWQSYLATEQAEKQHLEK